MTTTTQGACKPTPEDREWLESLPSYQETIHMDRAIADAALVNAVMNSYKKWVAAGRPTESAVRNGEPPAP